MSKEQDFPKAELEKYIEQQISQLIVIISATSPTLLPVYQGHLMALKKFAVDHDLKIKIELRFEHIFPNVVKEQEKEPKHDEPIIAIFDLTNNDHGSEQT